LLLQPNEGGAACSVACHSSSYTLTDIDTYIGKSEKVSSRDQLLSFLPERKDWHHSIQLLQNATQARVDQQHNHFQTGVAALDRLPPDQASLGFLSAGLQPYPGTDPTQSVAYDESQPQQEFSAAGTNSSQNSMTRFRRAGDWSTSRPNVGQNLNPQVVQPAVQPGNFPTDYHTHTIDPSPQGLHPTHLQSFLPGEGFAGPPFTYGDLVAPLGPYQNEPTMSPTLSTNINFFSSVTPIALTGELLSNGVSQRERLVVVVNGILDCGEDLEHKPAKRFIRLCVKACVFQGQEEDELRSQAVSEAARCFADVVDSFEGYTYSVSVLNEVSFLLESLGQAFVKLSVFQSIRSSLEIRDAKRQIVLWGSLDLLVETANWKPEKAAGLVPTAAEMFGAASDSAGRYAPTTIAIRYNQAWLLIEAKDYTQAIEILVKEKSQCEMCFGTRALQSVCWAATLARAHFMQGEAVVAEALMTETALTRAKAAFGQQHPIYWDIHWRIGYFLKGMAANNDVRRGLRQEYLDRGETMLYEALVWRARWLGPDNPQTAKVYNILKTHYQSHGRQSEAANLQDRYRAEAEN
jgi:hypothetical protein